MMIINIFRMALKFKYRIVKKEINSKAQFLTKRRISKLIIESILIMIHPSPFIVGKFMITFNPIVSSEIYYHYNDPLHLIQFYKIYIIIRSFLMLSPYSTNRARRVW